MSESQLGILKTYIESTALDKLINCFKPREKEVYSKFRSKLKESLSKSVSEKELVDVLEFLNEQDKAIFTSIGLSEDKTTPGNIYHALVFEPLRGMTKNAVNLYQNKTDQIINAPTAASLSVDMLSAAELYTKHGLSDFGIYAVDKDIIATIGREIDNNFAQIYVHFIQGSITPDVFTKILAEVMKTKNRKKDEVENTVKLLKKYSPAKVIIERIKAIYGTK